jgi:hypothetical protein
MQIIPLLYGFLGLELQRNFAFPCFFKKSGKKTLSKEKTPTSCRTWEFFEHGTEDEQIKKPPASSSMKMGSTPKLGKHKSIWLMR